MPGRNKHTEQPTASQGMRVYLLNCATSGLPHVKAIAEKYAELDPPARMRLYLADFGENFDKAPKVPASDNLLVRLGLDEGVEVVEKTTPRRTTRRRTLRKGAVIAKGTEFVYNSSGVVWTVKSVKGNVATATNGKRESTFKVTTLAIPGVATIAA